MYNDFQAIVWEKGDELYRSMSWRDQPTFYNVLVSEIMLQQTQVSRVLVKFTEFMTAFPTIEMLATASLADVLRVWQGLGYNRRAKFLHQAARYVLEHGEPTTVDGLTKLPGVGRNTAGAIMNYVYEIPTSYVETNIRTVYFHHFFHHETSVSDAAILSLVDATCDREYPREWFWALMDYGVFLKATRGGRLDQSRHYKKQAPLRGSVREVRGQIIKALKENSYNEKALRSLLHADGRFVKAIEGLYRDGLIQKSGKSWHLTR